MKPEWGKDTDQNISARSLTVLCGGVGIVWSTTTRTRVSDATAVSHFLHKTFYLIKTLSSVRKHLQKVVYFILCFLFIHVHLINTHLQ